MLPKYRAAIFVHGRFWHCHKCRYGCVVPATRADFWAEKRTSTTERDCKKESALRALGWRVLIVWECETRDRDKLTRILQRFMARYRTPPWKTKPTAEADSFPFDKLRVRNDNPMGGNDNYKCGGSFGFALRTPPGLTKKGPIPRFWLRQNDGSKGMTKKGVTNHARGAWVKAAFPI